MRKFQPVIVILLLGIGGKAFAGANVDACAKEMKRVLSVEINCQIQVRPDELATIREITHGVIKDLVCHIPIQFEKSAIYDQWIKPGQLSLPRLNLQCKLAVEDGQVLEMTSVIRPGCDKTGGKWNCEMNMSETRGIGLLGRILENYFNTDREVKRRLSEALESLE